MKLGEWESKLFGTGTEPSIRGGCVKEMLQNLSRDDTKRRQDNFDDSMVNGPDDLPTKEEVDGMIKQCWGDGGFVSFRQLSSMLLMRATALRGAHVRQFRLCHMGLGELAEMEGPITPQTVRLFALEAKGCSGVVEFLRHKHVSHCPVGALAFYFFNMFCVKGDPFPDLATRASWYKRVLFYGADREQGMSYSCQYQTFVAAYDKQGVTSTKKVHAGRNHRCVGRVW